MYKYHQEIDNQSKKKSNLDIYLLCNVGIQKILLLRVCLGFAYFAETEIFLLKVL